MIQILLILFLIGLLLVKKGDIEDFIRKNWLLLAIIVGAFLWIKFIKV